MVRIRYLNQSHASRSVKALFICAQKVAKFSITALVALLFVNYSYASTGPKCAQVVSNEQEIESQKTFRNLPQRNSAEYLKLVQDLQRQVKKNNAYGILDLRSFISEASGLAWANSFPKNVGSQIMYNEILYSQGREIFKQAPEAWQIEGIANLQKWLKQLIEDALPTAQLSSGFTNVRKATANNLGQSFDAWHIDGGDTSVTLSVEGLGTEVLGGAPLNMSVHEYHAIRGGKWETYCPDCKPIIVPAGFAFIFFGSKSGSNGLFSPTIHRTPIKAGSRTLFVIRYTAN